MWILPTKQMTFDMSAYNLLSFQENPLANIKKIDCALLPPSRRALKKKLLRAHYVTILWSHADTSLPSQGLDPTDYGWCRKENLLQPKWFDGPSVPDTLFSTNANGEDVNEENVDDSDSDETIDDRGQYDMSNIYEDDQWSEDSDSDIEEMEY